MNVLRFLALILICGSAWGSEPILPEDLQETDRLLVEKIVVDWKSDAVEHRFTRSCDEFIWDRLLIQADKSIPFDISFYELGVNEEPFYVYLGKKLSGNSPDKDDELQGYKRLLFKNLSRVILIIRSKTSPTKEVRIIVFGSC